MIVSLPRCRHRYLEDGAQGDVGPWSTACSTLSSFSMTSLRSAPRSFFVANVRNVALIAAKCSSVVVRVDLQKRQPRRHFFISSTSVSVSIFVIFPVLCLLVVGRVTSAPYGIIVVL
jgi:hypothetical protein